MTNTKIFIYPYKMAMALPLLEMGGSILAPKLAQFGKNQLSKYLTPENVDKAISLGKTIAPIAGQIGKNLATTAYHKILGRRHLQLKQLHDKVSKIVGGVQPSDIKTFSNSIQSMLPSKYKDHIMNSEYGKRVVEHINKL